MQKNQAIYIIIRDLVDLKIMQSGWPRAFWPISQEPNFSRIWDYCKNITNNITNFYYKPNSETTHEKKKKKFKMSYFWPIFHIFGASYFHIIWRCYTQLHMGFLTPCQNFEKFNEPISRKLSDGRTDPNSKDPFGHDQWSKSTEGSVVISV